MCATNEMAHLGSDASRFKSVISKASSKPKQNISGCVSMVQFRVMTSDKLDKASRGSTAEKVFGCNAPATDAIKPARGPIEINVGVIPLSDRNQRAAVKV